MADTFLFGSDERQHKDWQLLRCALEKQTNGEMLVASVEEIGNAMVLAEIVKILKQLIGEGVMEFPIGSVDKLEPLIAELPGVSMDAARKASTFDGALPITDASDFLHKCYRAIENYHQDPCRRRPSPK